MTIRRWPGEGSDRDDLRRASSDERGAPAGSDVIGKRVVSPSLIGREEEIRLLVSVLSAPPAAAVVEGDAGIGKTRLVSELRSHPELRDRWLMVGSCRHIREPFPLGAAVEAVRGLGDELAAATLSPVAGALRPLLPEVADLLPPLPEPLDDPVGVRHRVFRALVDVVRSVGPAILVLEDLHWADEQSLDWLRYLLADLPPKLSVVLTFRGDAALPRVRAVTSNLPAPVSRARVVLRPLDEQRTGELAAAILGTDRVSHDFARYLHERTGGLPFAIEEVLALLRTRGTLIPRGGGWIRRALSELEVPTAIRDSVLERVADVSRDAQRVCEAAAVLQMPVPVTVLLATVDATTAEATRAIDELIESGLFAEQGGVIGFRHLLAAQAVYDTILGSLRQDLHARAAAALEAVCPAPLGQVADHLSHADHVGAWVEVAERAADQAVELGHDTEAVRLLADVLGRAPLTPAQRGRLGVKLAKAAVETLDARDAIQLLTPLVEQGLPCAARSELRFRLALLLHQAGDDVHLERRLFKEAADELDDRPDLKAWAMVALGVPMPPQAEPAERSRWVYRALDLLPEVRDPTFETFLLGKAAMVLAPVGDPEWRRLTECIVERTGGRPANRHEVNAYWSAGVEACCTGHHEIARRLLTQGLDGSATHESSRLELSVRSALVLLDYLRGSWDGLGHRMLDLLDDVADYTRSCVEVQVVSGCFALAQGDLDAAQHRLGEVVPRVERLGGFDLLPVPVSALVRLAVARGDLDTAMANVQHFIDVQESSGIWAPAARAVPALTEAVLAAARPQEAQTLATRFASALRGMDAPLAPAALRHARGLLAAAAERRRVAVRHLVAAAELYEARLCPYEAAQAREQAAIGMFASDDVRAENTLRTALASYQRLGATWDSARVKGLARRHRVALPTPRQGGRRGYGQDLSPREREVAELAAAGRANKEIARELFLSSNTVDKHLRAALRKLGLHSRAGLAYHLFVKGGPDEGKNGGFPP